MWTFESLQETALGQEVKILELKITTCLRETFSYVLLCQTAAKVFLQTD